MTWLWWKFYILSAKWNDERWHHEIWAVWKVKRTFLGCVTHGSWKWKVQPRIIASTFHHTSVFRVHYTNNTKQYVISMKKKVHFKLGFMMIYHKSLIILFFTTLKMLPKSTNLCRLESVWMKKFLADIIFYFYVDSTWFEDYLMSY